MAQILDLQEWDECLGKMIRYHSNISREIRDLILKIRDLIIGGAFLLIALRMVYYVWDRLCCHTACAFIAQVLTAK